MRPAGVTSKKDMGDLKMAVAIRSCNFLDAYANHCLVSVGFSRGFWFAIFTTTASTYLDRAKDPQNQSLHHRKGGSTNAKHEIDAEIFPNVGVSACLGVMLGPVLEPHAST